MFTSKDIEARFLPCRYSIMSSCWERDPKARPDFSELVKSFVSQLSSMADYLTFAPKEEEDPV